MYHQPCIRGIFARKTLQGLIQYGTLAKALEFALGIDMPGEF